MCMTRTITAAAELIHDRKALLKRDKHACVERGSDRELISQAKTLFYT